MLPSPPVPIGVAVVGVGTIGRAVAAAVQHEPAMRLVGLVDIDPRLTGKRMADLGVDGDDPTTIVGQIERLDAVDVAIVCAGPQFDRIAPTLRQLMLKKAHVVSSCEQMTWPWLHHPHLADVIAGEARRAGLTLIGVGADPAVSAGATALPMLATRLNVTRIGITHTLDLSGRRDALLRRAGVTMSPTQFRTLATTQRVGHAGLGEMAVVLAQSLGRHPMRGEVRVVTVPRLAETEFESAIGRVPIGHVSGVLQTVNWVGEGLEISVKLVAALDAGMTEAEIVLEAGTVAHVHLPAELLDDDRTVATLVNAARHVPHLPNGLRTMLDLPPTAAR